MGWCTLKPLDDWYEMERPVVVESAGINSDDEAILTFDDDQVILTFTDAPSREWMAEWLRSKRGWAAFMAWVDEKR
jgi:hypothetical protein